MAAGGGIAAKTATKAAKTAIRAGTKGVEGGAVAARSGENIVYGVLRADEDITLGLFPKNPGGIFTVEDHVRRGKYLQTQFISTSRSLEVAERWAARTGNRIAQIDLTGYTGEVFDLTTEVARKTLLPGNKVARDFAKGSQEVVLLGDVPSTLIRILVGG